MQSGRVVAWVFGGALFFGSAVAACSSDDGEAPFDAGGLPDVDVGAAADASRDAHGDASPAPGVDATTGDDDAPSGDDDASHGGDASDASFAIDASDAAHEGDASDAGGGHDASDAGAEHDASDAGHDANDAASATDASANDGAAGQDANAGDDAGSGDDAGDASSIDDASDAASAADACAGYDTNVNPIQSVLLTDDGQTVAQPSFGSPPASASSQGPVVFVASTSPLGVVNEVQIGYCIGANGCATPTLVTMSTAADAGASGDDGWTGAIPALGAGTTVYWWVQAQDGCGGGWHYWSNFGHNFAYATQ